MTPTQQPKTYDIPLAIWPCAQRTSQWQRYGRYLPESNRHPAKMLPELARRVIETYSDPGDLVVDPMCGIGTTLVEAAHLGRCAIGVEIEQRWAKLAEANLLHATRQGAAGPGQVICGDARELPRLLARHAPDLVVTSPPYGDATLGDPSGDGGIEQARAVKGRRVTAADRARAGTTTRAGRYGQHPENVAALPYRRVDLVLTSPPYACEIGELHKQAWRTGAELCPTEARNYSPARENLGHARGRSYLAAMANIYAACDRVLKPGGFLVLVTKDMRSKGALRNLSGDTVMLCEQLGLAYWQHVIALLAARDRAAGRRPRRPAHRPAIVLADPAGAQGTRPRRTHSPRRPRRRACLPSP